MCWFSVKWKAGEKDDIEMVALTPGRAGRRPLTVHRSLKCRLRAEADLQWENQLPTKRISNLCAAKARQQAVAKCVRPAGSDRE